MGGQQERCMALVLSGAGPFDIMQPQDRSDGSGSQHSQPFWGPLRPAKHIVTDDRSKDRPCSPNTQRRSAARTRNKPLQRAAFYSRSSIYACHSSCSQIDDVFLSTNNLIGGKYRCTPADLQTTAAWQNSMNAKLPPGSNIRLDMVG